jgi:hypothetical protein
MTIKDLKALIKQFDDNDDVLIRWYIEEDWEIITSERELELEDCMESNYNWKRRLILDATRL